MIIKYIKCKSQGSKVGVGNPKPLCVCTCECMWVCVCVWLHMWMYVCVCVTLCVSFLVNVKEVRNSSSVSPKRIWFTLNLSRLEVKCPLKKYVKICKMCTKRYTKTLIVSLLILSSIQLIDAVGKSRKRSRQYEKCKTKLKFAERNYMDNQEVRVPVGNHLSYIILLESRWLNIQYLIQF